MGEENKHIKYSAWPSMSAQLDQDSPVDTMSFESHDIEPNRISSKELGHTKRHYGTHLPFYWKNNEPLFTIGPHWPLFVFIWALMLGSSLLFVSYVSRGKSLILLMTAILLTFCEVSLFLYAALKNPGIKTAKDPTDPNLDQYLENPNFCPDCRILKTENIRHCFDCDVCIKGHRRHCSLAGKCIGEGNHKPFCVALLSTVFYLIFCIAVIMGMR